MTVFIIEYRIEGYSLANAFSLNPRSGRRIFTVSSRDLGTDDISRVVDAAKHPDNVPARHRLHSVKDRDSGQVVNP